MLLFGIYLFITSGMDRSNAPHLGVEPSRNTRHFPCVLVAKQAAVGAVSLYLCISHRISYRAENLFMGFWAQLSQRTAAALMGAYVHSTVLRNTVCTLNALLRETFV